MRGRNNNNNNNNNNSGNRKSPNPLTRSYESNGPDVKIRGSAQQIAEKYATLARDAHSAGDRVMAENYLQHAEHYNRIIMAAQGQMPAPRDQRDEFDDEDGDDSGDQSYNQPQESRQPEARQNDGRQNENRDGRQQDGRQNDGRQGEGRQNDGRQRDNRREDGRREDGRRDGENQPREHRRDQLPQFVTGRDSADTGETRPQDGSGPQPVIEGMPAEVALEQEAMAGQKAAGRRRGRPPRARTTDETAVAEASAPAVAEPAAPAAAAPAAVEATAEAGEDGATRRPRRPRRPRNRDEGEQVAEGNADETPVAAQ